MIIQKISRRGMSGLLLAAAIFSTAGSAQDVGRPGLQNSIKPGKPDIVVNCCRCVGGKNEPVDISTGKASWTVSKTPTAAPPAVGGGYTTTTVGIVPTNTSPQVTPGNIGPNPIPGTWTNLLGADWLQPAPNVPGTSYNGTIPNGHWTYVLKVQVPNCTVQQKVVIAGALAADDAARMYVDVPSGSTQTLVGGPGITANFSADGSATRTFSATLNPILPGGYTQPGIYYIRVELDNLGGAPAGIVLKGTLTGECSDKLTRDDQKDGGGRGNCPNCRSEAAPQN
jgi:hypothetical protein